MFVDKNNELLEIHGPQSSNFATNGKSNYYYDKDAHPVIINCSRTAKPTLVSSLLPWYANTTWCPYYHRSLKIYDNSRRLTTTTHGSEFNFSKSKPMLLQLLCQWWNYGLKVHIPIKIIVEKIGGNTLSLPGNLSLCYSHKTISSYWGNIQCLKDRAILSYHQFNNNNNNNKTLIPILVLTLLTPINILNMILISVKKKQSTILNHIEMINTTEIRSLMVINWYA